MVLMMRQPPAMVPPPVARWAADNYRIRDMIIRHSASDQSGCDDAHAFLRVVRPMAEAVARSRKQL
jgi:hypothetical protein